MSNKNSTTITYGITECSKCDYKLRCDECVRNKKQFKRDLIQWIKSNSFNEDGCGLPCVYTESLLRFVDLINGD